MICITSYSILANGMPIKPFAAKKGLIQGDHMSPYLFALAMEYLSRSLTSLKGRNGFKFNLKCRKNEIIALLYVDDRLIFSHGSKVLVQLIQSSSKSFLKPLVYWQTMTN